MAEEYNGTMTEANFGWDTEVENLNIFYDVRCATDFDIAFHPLYLREAETNMMNSRLAI